MTTARSRFIDRLDALGGDLVELTDAVDGRVGDALRALSDRDRALASSLIERDEEINALRDGIERSCIALLAEQAPVATDLRLVVSTLFTATELERVGDYAVAIARILIRSSEDQPLPYTPELLEMAEQARAMLRRAVEALLARDAEAARGVGLADDAVDAAQDEIYRRMVELTAAEPHSFEARTATLWIVHNLERLADRATNIAEQAIYIATGESAELN